MEHNDLIEKLEILKTDIEKAKMNYESTKNELEKHKENKIYRLINGILVEYDHKEAIKYCNTKIKELSNQMSLIDEYGCNYEGDDN